MKIAIFLPNWIGDVVMATPAFRAMRRRFGSDQLLAVMRPYVADVLAGTTWFDGTLFYNPHSSERHLQGAALAAQLREQRVQLILLLTNSFRTAWIAWRSGAAERIGYDDYARGFLLTRRLRHPRHRFRRIPAPAVDSYLALARAAGCAPEPPRLELATTVADEAAADRVWQDLALPGGRVVALNCSGAYGAAKLWPPEYFAELAQLIADRLDYSVLVLCGPQERATAEQITQLAQRPAVRSLVDQPLSIGLTKACVRRSCLLVSTDSGPRHFAAAFNVPVVALFGPTHIAWSETYFAGETKLQHQVPCGPCSRRICPLGHHRCMRELSVERVYQAVMRQLVQSDLRKAG